MHLYSCANDGESNYSYNIIAVYRLCVALVVSEL